MSDDRDSTDDTNEPEPAAVRCIERTRSRVLNVLVVVGAGIAVSGWFLGRLDRGAFLWNPIQAWRVAVGALVAVFLLARTVLRLGAGRQALKDPSTRALKFTRTHVASAVIGGLAVPLGFAYGWGIQPRVEKIIPFWVVALATGFLAFPRGHELTGFDEPMPCPESLEQGKVA